MAQRNFNTNLTQAERERIGAQIKKLREDKGVTIQDLAFNCGIIRKRIYEIESGSVDFRIDTLLVILNYFNCEINIDNKK